MFTTVSSFYVKMFTMENELWEWIERNRKEKGWTQNELGRRAKLSSATISNIKTGMRGVGFESLDKLAKVFDAPKEMVYRLAHKLPPATRDKQFNDQLKYYLDQFSESEKEELLLFADMIIRKRKNKLISL